MKATSRESRSSFATATSHLVCLCRLQRRLQLWSAVERVGALAGLDLGELGDDLEALGRGKGGNGLALGFEAQAGTALLPVLTR